MARQLKGDEDSKVQINMQLVLRTMLVVVLQME